jgi:glutaredoxin
MSFLKPHLEIEMIWCCVVVLFVCLGCGESESVVEQPKMLPTPVVKQELPVEPVEQEDMELSALSLIKYVDISSLDKIMNAVEKSSSEGNLVAQLIVRQCILALGRDYLLEQKIGARRRNTKSKIKTWTDMVADKSLKGDPFFAAVFARIHQVGVGLPKNVPRAVSLLENAADAGSGPAQLALARHYETNRRGSDEANPERVRQLYMAAGENGLPPAWFALGEILAYGEDETLRDLDKALEYWMKAAARGHAKAQYRAGIAYLEKGSELLGLSLLTGAARQGNLPAAAQLRKLDHNWGEVMNLDEYRRYIQGRERVLARHLEKEPKKSAPRVNVTILMYSKPNCTRCDEARQYMQSKYMEFVELDIQKDAEARAVRDRLSPKKMLPILKIGEYSMEGFDEESFLRILTMAAKSGR